MKMSIFLLDDKQDVKLVVSWLVDNEVLFDFCPEHDGLYEISIDTRWTSKLESAFKGTKLQRVMHSQT
jgi:hypothetical protein